jgi:hypothetical protein
MRSFLEKIIRRLRYLLVYQLNCGFEEVTARGNQDPDSGPLSL